VASFAAVVKKILPLSVGEFTIACVVFITYFLSAKLGLFVYYTFETSPALIWPPVGIALVAMLYGGYRMWLPILLAQHIALITERPGVELVSFVIAVSYALQALVGAFVLRRFDFEPGSVRLKDTWVLIGVAFFVTAIEPIILTLFQDYFNTLTVTPIVSFTRAWGGGIFSALIIAPFAFSWASWRNENVLTIGQRFEFVAAIAVLLGVNHLVFWTPYAAAFGISVIFFVPAVLIWFAMRFHPRWTTLALFLTAIQGIAGAIIAQTSPAPLSQQLLNIEIYLGFIAGIFLAFAAVVHERRLAYVRLEKAYEYTFASDKAKNEFIAILAHELRNPLAPILSAIEYLKLQKLDNLAKETVKNMEEQAIMMRRLLDDLLDTARITQKSFKLQKERVSLNEIIQKSVAGVGDFVRSRRHALTVTLPKESIMLDADPVRLRQIVMNLLNNSCKYTEPGGRIEVRAEERNDYALIEVVDNGVGLEPSAINELFQPFKQMQDSTQRGTGLGIGLFLTKRLTEMHQGKLVASSEGTGKGSTFGVYLPLPDQRSLPGFWKTKGEMPRSSTKRVLVVDDNEVAANMLKRLLSAHGYEAEAVYSGEDALQRLESFAPDLLLLDIGMPVMDGYETTAKAREMGWEGKIAAISGYGQDTDKQRSEKAGFDHHLVKPVPVEEVLALLREKETPAATE
jgi:signal transduction histidine kinase/CheY-like chemotaxis protein